MFSLSQVLFYFMKGCCRIVKDWFYGSVVGLCGGSCRQGNAGPACDKGPVSPPFGLLLPRITFQAEVSQTRLLFHIKVAPGELRQSPAWLWRCADRRSVDFLPLKSRLQVTYEVSFFCVWSLVICVSTSEPGPFLSTSMMTFVSFLLGFFFLIH